MWTQVIEHQSDEAKTPTEHKTGGNMHSMTFPSLFCIYGDGNVSMGAL
jgi:hypothetical protein